MAAIFHRLTLPTRAHARLYEAMAIQLCTVRRRSALAGTYCPHEAESSSPASSSKVHPVRCGLPQACQPRRHEAERAIPEGTKKAPEPSQARLALSGISKCVGNLSRPSSGRSHCKNILRRRPIMAPRRSINRGGQTGCHTGRSGEDQFPCQSERTDWRWETEGRMVQDRSKRQSAHRARMNDFSRIDGPHVGCIEGHHRNGIAR